MFHNNRNLLKIIYNLSLFFHYFPYIKSGIKMIDTIQPKVFQKDAVEVKQ
jgi:hypothetical protein